MSKGNISLPFKCPVCGKKMSRNLSVVIPHVEKHITEEIQKHHPDWKNTNGICKKCYEYYGEQLHKK